MSPIRRTAVALKSAALSIAMRFSGGMRSGWSMLLRGTAFDYRAAVGDGTGNSAVMACLLWLVRTFPEAPVRVSAHQPDGSHNPVVDHPMVMLIEQPNPYYSGEELWMATLIDFTSGGNAYWRKIRNGQRGVAELWYIPATMIRPMWPPDGSAFITHYEYTPGSTPERVATEDIIHFKFGVDPRNVRMGLSPLASVLREVFADDEAANFSGTLLRNLGIPGGILSPDSEGVTIQPEDAEGIKTTFRQRTTGDNRGDVIVMSNRMKFDLVAFNPQQMDMKTLRRLPEERIAAVLGIPAGVVGLGAGLDHNTYSNVEEGRKAAYESNLIPTQRLFAAKLRTALLPEFGDTKGLRIEFDRSGVLALQESQDKLWARADTGVKGGWLTVAAAKRIVGQDAGDDEEYYLRSWQVQAVPLADAAVLRVPTRRTETITTDTTAGLPAAASPVKMLPAPSTKAASETHQRRVERLSGPFERSLKSYFGQQETAILGAWGSKAYPHTNGHTAVQTKAVDVITLLGPEWDETLEKLTLKLYLTIGEEAASVAGTQLGIEGLFDLALPRIKKTADRLAKQVTRVNDTTRDDLRRVITNGSDAGYSLDQIAHGVPDSGYGGIKGVMQQASESRAKAIARTETATALNHSTIDAYHGSGVVTHVDVVDGDEDEACAEANGSVWTLDEARDNPLGHPNCLIGSSLVTAPKAHAAFARWFDGEVVILRTAANDLLTCTPNHPVLTSQGWRAAGSLREGDNVIRCLDSERVARLIDPDHNQVPTRIDKVAGALLKARGVTPRAMPSTAEDFHGDGAGSDVYVIGADCLGGREGHAALSEHRSELSFSFTDVGLAALFTEGAAGEVFGRALHTTDGIMSSVRERGAATGTNALRAYQSGVAAVAERQTIPTEPAAQRRTLDANISGDMVGSLAGLIAPIEVMSIERRQFAGHVYNLETTQGWYIADSIITHNCTRAWSPIVNTG